jgi:hypothetical protein
MYFRSAGNLLSRAERSGRGFTGLTPIVNSIHLPPVVCLSALDPTGMRCSLVGRDTLWAAPFCFVVIGNILFEMKVGYSILECERSFFLSFAVEQKGQAAV